VPRRLRRRLNNPSAARPGTLGGGAVILEMSPFPSKRLRIIARQWPSRHRFRCRRNGSPSTRRAPKVFTERVSDRHGPVRTTCCRMYWSLRYPSRSPLMKTRRLTSNRLLLTYGPVFGFNRRNVKVRTKVKLSAKRFRVVVDRF